MFCTVIMYIGGHSFYFSDIQSDYIYVLLWSFDWDAFGEPDCIGKRLTK